MKLRITDRRGLLRALNTKLSTEYIHSRYVGVKVDNMGDRTRLIFRHNNGVGRHVEVVSWNGPHQIGVPQWMAPYVTTE